MKMFVCMYLVTLSFLFLTDFNTVMCNSYASRNSSCPTWMYHVNDYSHCVCGVNLTTAVVCDPSLQQVKVRGCHMVSFDPATNETYAGYSFYRCVKYFSKSSTVYFPVPMNASRVNFEMCD